MVECSVSPILEEGWPLACYCFISSQVSGSWKTLDHWFSAFLMLKPFNTFHHDVVIPNYQKKNLPLHSCHFATVMNAQDI